MRVRVFLLGKVFLASREELKWLTRPRASKASKETKHVQGSGEYLKFLLKLLYIHTCICIGKLKIIKSKQISCKKIQYKLIMYSHAAFPLPSGLWPNFSPAMQHTGAQQLCGSETSAHRPLALAQALIFSLVSSPVAVAEKKTRSISSTARWHKEAIAKFTLNVFGLYRTQN
jgi:hypothetical protein